MSVSPSLLFFLLPHCALLFIVESRVALLAACRLGVLGVFHSSLSSSRQVVDSLCLWPMNLFGREQVCIELVKTMRRYLPLYVVATATVLSCSAQPTLDTDTYVSLCTMFIPTYGNLAHFNVHCHLKFFSKYQLYSEFCLFSRLNNTKIFLLMYVSLSLPQ